MISFVTIYKHDDLHLLPDLKASLPNPEIYDCEFIFVETMPIKCQNEIEFKAMNDTHHDKIFDVKKIGHETHAKYYFIPRWDNDLKFDEARNAAKTLAKGDWIFSIDTDDRMLIHQHKRLFHLEKELEKMPDIMGAACWQIDYIIDPFENKGKIQTATIPRIFKNVPDIKWESNIHETFEMSIARMGKETMDSGIILHHIGYTDNNVMEKKALRNIFGLMSQDLTKTEKHFFDLMVRDTVLYHNLQQIKGK